MRLERLVVDEWPTEYDPVAVSTLIGSVLLPASGRIEDRYSSDYGYDDT